MKKHRCFPFFLCLLLFACQPYGKKVRINDASEVYYKGEDLTEADARKLGDFLLRRNFFDGTAEKSVQLQRQDSVYLVRFVVDEGALDKDRENALLGFKVWQMWIRDSVFSGAPTRVILANSDFSDLQDAGEFTLEEQNALLEEQAGVGALDSSRSDLAPVDGASRSDSVARK